MGYRQCQYEYKGNSTKKCPHPALPGEKYCIFHLEQEGKSLVDIIDYLDRYKSHYPKEPLDLEEAYLVNADLENSNLPGTNFRGANLEGAILTNSDLSNCNFQDANLTKTVLSGAKLSNCDFSGANLSKADLVRADLSNSRFYETTIIRANFEGANLINAEFYQVEDIYKNKFNTNFSNLLDSSYVFIPPNELVPIDDEREGNEQLNSGNIFNAIKSYHKAVMAYSKLREYYFSRGYYELSDIYFVHSNRIKNEIYKIVLKKVLLNKQNIDKIVRDNEIMESYFGTTNKALGKRIRNHKKLLRTLFFILSFLESAWNLFWRSFIRVTSRYGTSIARIFASSVFVIIVFSWIYWYLEIPSYYNFKGGLVTVSSFWDTLYFSIVTFTTLGYGDYAPHNYKLIAASEALLGAFFISYFVVVVVRKILR
ncbi:MAG: hypothetical protein GXO39_07315 [Thermotogae bacterium]|nr:hypothetical protein [Thermotogota bacterium]